MLLRGIKVLDLSNLLPGPICSLFLADLGAEVIKIEGIEGDPLRHFYMKKNKNGKFTNNKNNPYFLYLARNKKSIAINIKMKEGKKIFLNLAKNADIIIEGFRPGKVDKLGIGYNHIKKINKKIIYCSVSGYGQYGPDKNKAGHDINFMAISGIMDYTFNRPKIPLIQIADYIGGLIAVYSILAALHYRQQQRKGNYIDISMLDGMLSLFGPQIANYSSSHNFNPILAGRTACYNIYETKDKKYVCLAAIEIKFWKRFCEVIERSDLFSKQFSQNKNVILTLKKIFKSKTKKQWVTLNRQFDFCCDPLKKIKEIYKDKHLKARKRFITLDNEIQIATPTIFSEFHKNTYSPAPNLGQHTKHILRNLRYNKDEIRQFFKNKVVL